MRSTGCIWLIVAVAACGGGTDHGDGVRSGSRLRATFLVDAEGARQFRTFHDRTLDLDCNFQGDPPRCLPATTWTSIFRDAACTDPLYARVPPTDDCATLPDRIGVAGPDGCGGLLRIWELGVATARQEVFFVDSASGDCVSVPADPALEYYRAGNELSLDDFVSGSYRIEGAGQVRERVVVGADGSRHPLGLHDVELDSDCWYEDSLATCIPDFVWQGYRADDACEIPIGSWSVSACSPAPAYTGRMSWDEDGVSELWLYERGPDVSPTVLYSGPDAASCAPVTPDFSLDYYLPGGEIPDERLAVLERVADDDRRLQGFYVTSADGLRAFEQTFFDRDLLESCYPSEVAPGSWRCLPSSLPWVSTYSFSDAQCTEPIEVLEVYPPTELAPGVAWRRGECGIWTAHLMEPGDELAPGSLYFDNGTGCFAETWETASVRRYRVGAELTFDDYVELTPRTE